MSGVRSQSGCQGLVVSLGVSSQTGVSSQSGCQGLVVSLGVRG